MNRIPEEDYLRLTEQLNQVRHQMGIYGNHVRMYLSKTFGRPAPLGGKIVNHNGLQTLMLHENFLAIAELEQVHCIELILKRDYRFPQVAVDNSKERGKP